MGVLSVAASEAHLPKAERASARAQLSGETPQKVKPRREPTKKRTERPGKSVLRFGQKPTRSAVPPPTRRGTSIGNTTSRSGWPHISLSTWQPGTALDVA